MPKCLPITEYLFNVNSCYEFLYICFDYFKIFLSTNYLQ